VRRPLVIAAAIAAAGAAVVLLGDSHREPPVAAGRLPFAVGFNESLALTHRSADPVRWRRLIDLDAGLHRKAGSTILRTVLHWDATERTPGRFDFSVPDELVERYGAAGVRLLFILDGAPRWARDARLRRCAACYSVPPADARLAAWGRFVGRVAQRYGGRIAGIDVWNEPNLRGFWRDVPVDPRRYTRLLCRAHAAVAAASRRSGRRVPVGGGALAGTLATTSAGMSLPRFLTGMLRSGAGRCMDALSFHPYPDAPDVGSAHSSFQRTFAVVRALRDRYARGLPLWITETGWRSAGPSGRAEQARVLVRILRVVAAMAQHDVRMLVFHTLVADPSAPGGAAYGIVGVGPDGSLRPSPAFRALSAEIAGQG
jgi:polysaccharide biosynthesis protein PslG